MITQTASRRHAIIVLVCIGLLVCVGLAWATWSAVRLEGLEDSNARARSYDETRALALARLDGLVGLTLGPERSRPYDIFRSYYKPAKAYDPRDWAERVDPIVLPSPLQSFRGPDWLLLHFQASVTSGWSSPQLESGEESAIPASAIPAVERRRLATAANWLAALRGRYDPWSLLQVVEEAQIADIEKRQAYKDTSIINSVASDQAKDIRGKVKSERHSRTAAEFARRGSRLLQLQREHYPEEQCEPQLVALDNLQMDAELGSAIDPTLECVQVYGTPMLPVWLDLTMDGRSQLALVRAVSVERSQYCTIQGVLVDWDRLRQILEAEVHDLLPDAKVEPVPIETRPEPDMLHTIPARLISRMPASSHGADLSSGLKWGLIVAWGATILAFVSLCYWIMKYVMLSERRMRFVAAVTHELRTPLTSFQLYTDLMAEMTEAKDKPRLREYVHILQKQSKRLARLVENVLVYSKIGGSGPVLNTETVSAQTLLTTITEIASDACRAAGKKLVVENRCADDLRIETDRECVLQILGNLIENACKYSKDASDPHIWLSAMPTHDGGVILEVEDAGRGVAASDRKLIFEPFHRGGSQAEEQEMGLGLGLALSRYWAVSLGGQLILRRGTRNGRHYSCFSLSLPVRI